jgi:hypothetical protein
MSNTFTLVKLSVFSASVILLICKSSSSKQVRPSNTFSMLLKLFLDKLSFFYLVNILNVTCVKILIVISSLQITELAKKLLFILTIKKLKL